jgi:hypothetical protein
MTPMVFLDGPLKGVVLQDNFYPYYKHTYGLLVKDKNLHHKLYCDIICKGTPPKELPEFAYRNVVQEIWTDESYEKVSYRNLTMYYKEMEPVPSGGLLKVIEIKESK